MAGHLLVLEGPARDPAGCRSSRGCDGRPTRRGSPAGRRSSSASSTPAKPLPMRGAGHVDELAGEEMSGGQLGADLEQRVRASRGTRPASRFGSTFALAKWPRCGLVDVLRLGRADAELHGGVAVRLGGAHGDHLALLDLQHGHRDVGALVAEERGSCRASVRSDRYASSALPPLVLQLDLDVDAGGEVELHQRVDRLRRRIDDVEQALVGADLELLAALLVDVRRAVAP